MRRSPAKPVTVLVVEDNHDLCDALALRATGYEVTQAGSAEAALAASAELDHTADVVVTDVVLPGISGVELVALLASRRPDLPAMFMSGYSDYMLEKYGLADEEENFLLKPFDTDSLDQKIRNRLGAEHATDGAATRCRPEP